MKELIIIGAGGHVRSVLSTAKLMDLWGNFKIFDINFTNKEERILGFKVYPFENLSDFHKNKSDYFIAIGDNSKRKSISKNLKTFGCNFVNVIHPNSFIDNHSTMGIGNFVGQFSNIGASSKLGDFNIINSYGNIEHEVIIGNFNQLAPSSTICGRSQLRDENFIGANAVIIENLSLANNTIIGAGAVVIKSINESNQKLGGVPAKVL
ncbi:hypothetical protein B0W81_00600 [Prochlorococcus sp. HOT_208_60]|nr:hypothetical protein B0W81_00600 [Prochlorococcus sp. HOT_208_60]